MPAEKSEVEIQNSMGWCGDQIFSDILLNLIWHLPRSNSGERAESSGLPQLSANEVDGDVGAKAKLRCFGACGKGRAMV